MRTTIRTTLALAPLLVAGCALQPPAPANRTPVYATDMMGKAAACVAPLDGVKDGAANPVTMTTGGGGWCGITLSRDGHPFAAGLLVKPAASGKVYVHAVGDETRIDYTPARVPVAPDSFTVRLLPGDATIVVSVAATPGVTK